MRYVIAGGGVAGVTAAKEIRKLDPEGRVDLFSSESYPYYFRPKLWEFIAGRISPEATYYRPESWYAEQGINLYLHTAVTGLDTNEKVLTLANERAVSFDRLVIASGGRSFVPPVEGVGLDGVFALRTLDDAKAIVTWADTVQSAVLIGGGLLGLETAKALADRGLMVSVVEFMPRLLPRQLDEPGADVLQAYLEKQSLGIYLDGMTEKIISTPGGLTVQLGDGRQIETGMVVFSTGIRSNIEPWQSCGLPSDRGVQVDDYLMTAHADIYAAGDAAEYDGIVYGIIPAATEQGKIAGANAVSARNVVYTGTIPSTRLKIAGMAFNAYGDSTLEGEGIVVRRVVDVAAGRYERVAIQKGVIRGAIILGDSRKGLSLKRLIEVEMDVSAHADRLLEDDFDLKSLASA
ncbi:MAG: FAD-dependent oxidoreductase [Anaerolineaceae bacterium]|jgi:nitrite reductase (NADH) large subunit|nr:FAD-dependent oxidoreductase [Anaerolineaceae bacterium]